MVNNNHKHVCISLENMGSGFFPKRKKKEKRGLIEKERGRKGGGWKGVI